MEVIMAVEIRVMRNGKPVQGVSVSYQRSMGYGAEKRTDSQGYVSYAVDAGPTLYVKVDGKKHEGYYLKKGLNEFRIWFWISIILIL
jgi:hypothetical protein